MAARAETKMTVEEFFAGAPRGSRWRDRADFGRHGVRAGRARICGPRWPPDAIEVPNPVVVVEVLSHATEWRDRGVKRKGRFSLSSVMQYLILDPDERMPIHYWRGQRDVLEARILSGGDPRLEPPVSDLPLAELFAPEDSP